MRKYNHMNGELLEIKCNQCGRSITVKGSVVQEDICHVEKIWGYFSGKDGIRQEWDLCEACYEKLINGFVIPLDENEITEFV